MQVASKKSQGDFSVTMFLPNIIYILKMNTPHRLYIFNIYQLYLNYIK